MKRLILRAIVTLALPVLCGSLAQAGDLTNLLYAKPRVGGLAELELKAQPNAKDRVDALMRLPLVVSYGGIRSSGGGDCSVSLCPVGFVVKSTAPGLEIFEGLKQPPKGPDPRPSHLAYVSKGKVAVVALKESGSATLEAMSEPWVLFWGGPAPFLLLAQNPVTSVEKTAERVKVAFADKTGTVVLLPAYGQLKRHPTAVGGLYIPEKAFLPDNFSRTLQTKPESEWHTELPEAVVTYVRGWAKRLRRIPTDFSESFTIADDNVKITESFQYEDIDDHWKTPKTPWAIVPPAFALSRAMKGPVTIEGECQELPWLCPFGPLTIVDGKDSVTFTIKVPRLKEYLWGKPAAGDVADLKAKALQTKLRQEIDKVLEVNEHMAPFRNLGTGGGNNSHWGNPGETVISLCWALPYLDKDKADALRAYIKKEVQQNDPLKVSYTPPGVGARREFYEPYAEGKAGPAGGVKTPNLLNLYATWEYVDKVVGPDAGKALWPEVKKYLLDDLSKRDFLWDAGEAPRVSTARGVRHSELNCRLAGYIGFTRLARLAGDQEAEALGTCLLARGLAALHGQAHYHQFLIDKGFATPLPNLVPDFEPRDKHYQAHLLPLFANNGLWFNAGFYNSAWPYVFFMDLTPEVGQFLHDHAHDPVASTVRWMMWRCPSIWFNRGIKPFQSSQGENWVLEPYVPWVNFLALATAVQEPAEELAWYVGDSRARFGDLYYLQRLSLALRWFAREKKGPASSENPGR